MKFPHMTTSIAVHGGKRSQVLMYVMYMLFIIGCTEVYSALGPPNTCGLQDGCMFDEDIGILNCQNLDLQTIPLEVCPEVTYLDMRYNNLAKLSTRIHTYCPNLEKLDLGATQVTAITPNVFNKCDSLTIIYLDSNEIRSLKRGSFEDLTSLEYLYLSGNKISHIQSTIFDPLNKTLLYLDLSHNVIDRIDEGSFYPLRNLRRLFLQHNQLTYFNSGMLRGLRSLTHLYLSNNYIEYIPHNAFQYTLNLKELKLGNNPELIAVHSGALNHLPQLCFLDLMRTQISTLRNVSHLFSSRSELKTFHISETRLACDESFEAWKEWYKGPENHPRKTARCIPIDSGDHIDGHLDVHEETTPVTTESNIQKLSSSTQMNFNFLGGTPNAARRNQIQVIIITAMTFLSLSFNS